MWSSLGFLRSITSSAALAGILLTQACGPSAPESAQLKDQFAGQSFFYYAQDDRTEILEQLKKGLVANYAPLAIKKQRLGLDIEALLTDAIAAEAAIADVSTATEQAAANLAFLDRAHKTVATLRDTHVWMTPVVNPPVILNGLELAEVSGKFHIVGIREKLIQYAAANSATPQLYSNIALGDEVTAIDGRAVGELVAELMPYEGSSTINFQRSRAVSALTRRNYKAPEQAVATYSIRKASGAAMTIELPYFYNTKGGIRPDAALLFKERGFIPAADLKLDWDTTKRTWVYNTDFPVTGYDSSSQMPAGLIATEEWNGDYGLTMRTGFFLRDGKAYGLLQIFGFMGKTLTNSVTGAQKPFTGVISGYVASLAETKTPLILDLRHNGGGNTAFTMPVLAAIAKTGESYPAFTKSFRVTRKIRQMFEAYQPNTLNESELDRIEHAELQSAIADRRTHTNALAQADAITSSIGGYDEPVTVLIGPACISSCDITSMLMKASNRTTIIGTHSNGTGAGMTSYSGFSDASWRDDFDVIEVNIPNFLFGKPGPADQLIHTGSAYFDLNSENVPVEADLIYNDQLSDFLQGGTGWFNKAIEAIKAQQ